jgi:hypothetical protein
MKPSTLLRVVSGLLAFGVVGHTMGMLTVQPRDAEEAALLQTMHSYHFDAMGSIRTYWDFFFAFGLLFSLLLLLLAALCWLLADLAETDPARARPFVLLVTLTQITALAMSVTWFFAAPIIMSSLTIVFLIWALVLLRTRTAKAVRASEWSSV